MRSIPASVRYKNLLLKLLYLHGRRDEESVISRAILIDSRLRLIYKSNVLGVRQLRKPRPYLVIWHTQKFKYLESIKVNMNILG
jgi:hypothetical protein